MMMDRTTKPIMSVINANVSVRHFHRLWKPLDDSIGARSAHAQLVQSESVATGCLRIHCANPAAGTGTKNGN
jgi:hypothetical protein